MLRFTFLLVFLFAHRFCHAQDSLVSQVITRIAALQTTEHSNYLPGNFPSYITNNSFFARKKRDENVFYAALINFTLQKQRASLLPHQKKIVDSIQQNSSSLYPHFRNQKGRLTYNFWRTDTAFVFPYTNWIKRVKKNTSLPDDMDDTVLSLLAQDCDSTTAAEAHIIMQDYVNGLRNSKTIEKPYWKYQTYSVWYGKRFPPVYDVCVLANILTFVEKYKLRWTNADSAALQVILTSVYNDDYITKPIYISPYYGSTSLILYHLSRLMCYCEIPQLEALKTSLIVSAVNRFSQSDDSLEKIILSTAILNWGYQPPTLTLPDAGTLLETIEQSNLPFFTGNIPSYFPRFYKHLFTSRKKLMFYHYCPAFNDALLLEYLLLQKGS